MPYLVEKVGVTDLQSLVTMDSVLEPRINKVCDVWCRVYDVLVIQGVGMCMCCHECVQVHILGLGVYFVVRIRVPRTPLPSSKPPSIPWLLSRQVLEEDIAKKIQSVKPLSAMATSNRTSTMHARDAARQTDEMIDRPYVKGLKLQQPSDG